VTEGGPPPTELFDWELRERDDEDRASSTYDANYHASPIARRWDADFASFVAETYRPGDRVLDLGCGPGSLWPYWSALPDVSTLVGVDLSPRMVDVARRRHPAGTFLVGRAHDLPFPDGSFDLVIASAVLHHVPPEHQQGAVDEIHRVLDEHGAVVGRDPSGAHRFGRTPPWFSGAIMHLRHLALRETRTRLEPEPRLGDHHHVPDPDRLLAVLSTRFTVLRAESRFPFSTYLAPVRAERIARLALALDERLKDRPGSMLYYAAAKNYSTPADVRSAVARARAEELPPLTDSEFLAYVQAAAEAIDRLCRDDDVPRD
jgi:SAM-dependent methyltransferase